MFIHHFGRIGVRLSADRCRVDRWQPLLDWFGDLWFWSLATLVLQFDNPQVQALDLSQGKQGRTFRIRSLVVCRECSITIIQRHPHHLRNRIRFFILPKDHESLKRLWSGQDHSHLSVVIESEPRIVESRKVLAASFNGGSDALTPVVRHAFDVQDFEGHVYN